MAISWLRTVAALVLLAFVAVPADAQMPRPDNIFTISGFVPQFANTPRKLAHLRALPPDRLLTRTRNGKTLYLYADPNGCVCVYVGTADAWRTYQNGGPPGYAGDTSDKPLPRYNSNQMIDEMSEDPYVNDPGAPSMDDYLFGRMD